MLSRFLRGSSSWRSWLRSSRWAGIGARRREVVEGRRGLGGRLTIVAAGRRKHTRNTTTKLVAQKDIYTGTLLDRGHRANPFPANQVNVPKTRRTYCKGKDCKKHTQHKVTQYKAGKVSQSSPLPSSTSLPSTSPSSAPSNPSPRTGIITHTAITRQRIIQKHV